VEAELLGVQQLQKLWRRLVGHFTVLVGACVIVYLCYAIQWQIIVHWHQHSIFDWRKTSSLRERKRRGEQVLQLDCQAFSCKSAALAVRNNVLRMHSLYKCPAVPAACCLEALL